MVSCSVSHRYFTFPCGEPHVILHHELPRKVRITWEFQSAVEIVELLLLKDALNREGHTIESINVPYIPFARQDRVNVQGEPLSIAVMAHVLNSLEAEKVSITDPHSDVTTALIKNVVVIEQADVFYHQMSGWIKDYALVSPDGGALKKIYKLARKLQVQVLECSKYREVSTGDIKGVWIPGNVFPGKCVIVDDICDGGRTFVELAKELIKRGATSVILCVTHGFFTKGLQVFDGLIDEIYTRKGRVK